MSAYTTFSERCTAQHQDQWLLERLFCEHPSRKHLLESRLAKGLAGKLSSCWSLPPAVLLRTQAFLRKGGRTVKGGRQAKHHHSSHTPADQCAAGHHLSLQGVARQKTALAVQAFLHQSRTGTCFPPCLLEYTDAGACTVWQGELRGRLRRGEGGEPDTGARSPPRALYSTRFAFAWAPGTASAPRGPLVSVQCTNQSIAAEHHIFFSRSRQARSEPRQQLQLKAQGGSRAQTYHKCANCIAARRRPGTLLGGGLAADWAAPAFICRTANPRVDCNSSPRRLRRNNADVPRRLHEDPVPAALAGGDRVLAQPRIVQQ